MVQTLIANSGIQFFSREILLDANDGFRQVFYEWFDEEQVEQVLEYAYEIRETLQGWFRQGLPESPERERVSGEEIIFKRRFPVQVQFNKVQQRG